MSTYTPIATQTLGSATASVTFSSIPQGYTDLVIVCNLAVNGTGNNVLCRYNGDTASNYSTTLMSGNGSSAYSARYSNSSNGWLTGYFDGTANEFYTKIIQIQNYSNTTTYKTALGRTSSGSREAMAGVGLWRSTAAITSVTLAASDFNTGSTFSIYGIAAGATGAKAAGGIVTSDNSYVYHTFLNSGIFMPYQNLTCDYLVVAGGGGGSKARAGGGGAGGLRSTVTATGGGGSLETALSLTAQGYTVTVGAGGTGGTSDVGVNGSNSVFSTITSIGGGTGGSANGGTGIGSSGGSGGGGAGSNGDKAGGAGTANQGFAGGTAKDSAPNYGAGGGGGAGAVGVAGTTTSGGNGGSGVATSISGTSTTYAGGGGGGTYQGGTAGTGQAGGGNGATNDSAGGAATANTGSGGGGGGYQSSGGNGGNGGSGIVVIRYAI